MRPAAHCELAGWAGPAEQPCLPFWLQRSAVPTVFPSPGQAPTRWQRRTGISRPAVLSCDPPHPSPAPQEFLHFQPNLLLGGDGKLPVVCIEVVHAGTRDHFRLQEFPFIDIVARG